MTAPVIVKAAETSPGEFTFSWNKVENAVSYSYRLADESGESVAAHEEFDALTVVLNGGESRFVPGSKYTFFVRADAEPPYTHSDWTERDVVCGTEQLPAPRIVSAEVEQTTLVVIWETVEHADGYSYRVTQTDGTVVAEETATEPSCRVEGLSPGSTYTFSVQAFSDGHGYTPSEPATVEVTVDAIELTPPTITSASATRTEIHVAWEAAANAARYGYTLTDIRDGSQVAEGETDLFAADFSDLTPGVTYTFSVRSLPGSAQYAPSTAAHKNITTEPQEADKDFEIIVDRVTTVSVGVSIVPKDNAMPYFFDIFLTNNVEGLDDEAAMNWIYNMYYTADDIYEMLSYGPDSYEWKTLQPEEDFTILCFGHDGWNRTTDIYRMRVITRSVSSSDATLGIDFEVVDAGTVDYNSDHDGLPGIILRFSPGQGCVNYKYSIYDEDVLEHWSESYMINFLLVANDWYDGVYNAESESDGNAFYVLGPREAMLVMREEFWNRRVRALAIGLDADDNPGPLVNVLIGIPPRGSLTASPNSGRRGSVGAFPYKPISRTPLYGRRMSR